jgi:hypothetical protein
MLYQYFFKGGLSLGDVIWTIIGYINPGKDWKLAYDLLLNLISNIRLALSGNASVGDIVAILPDFAMTILGALPLGVIMEVISNVYPIAQLL